MIAIFLALASTALSQSQMALRTGTICYYGGIAQLQLGSLSYAGYNIVFNKTLPDGVYNAMVCKSYLIKLSVTFPICPLRMG